MALHALSACASDAAPNGIAPNGIAAGASSQEGGNAGASSVGTGGAIPSLGGASGGALSSLGGSSGSAGNSGGSGATTGSDKGGNGGGAELGGAGGASEVSGAGGVSGMFSGSGGASTGGAAGAGNTAPKVTLFDGQGLSQWLSRSGGGDAPWNVMDAAFVVVPNSGDIETRQSFGDIQLHVEFWIPKTPATNAEQDRGNSGIYLQGRYEVQVLDSYLHPLDGANDCGAIYELKNADVNASLPPENWQTYEITFRAAHWSGNTKLSNATISVTWNGQQAQSDVEVPAPTRLGDPEAPGDAPLRLQDHGHGVRYRNIWLQKL